MNTQELAYQYTIKLDEEHAQRASEWLTKSLGWPIIVSDCLGSSCKDLLDRLLTEQQQIAYGRSFILFVWR